MTDVIVIGGGIVGSAATYRLARSGLKVTLIDRHDQGQATAAGAGIISPGTSFRPPAPFYPLAAKAVEFYPTLVEQLAEDGETEIGYETVGALFVATNESEMTRLDEILNIAEQRHAAGVQGIGTVSRVDTQQAKELFPAIGDIQGGIYVPGSARMNGMLMRDALQRAAQKHGARVLQGDARPVRHGDQVAYVDVDGQKLTADALVIAGGAWSASLARMLDIHVPVYPQRGQILHLEIPHVDTSRWPIVLGFHSHYILTFPSNRVVAGATREDHAGYDYRMTAGGIHEALSEALRLAPGLERATLRDVKIGFRPASPDHLPILGQAPGLRNVWLATGHGASGLQVGPYSGAVIADLVRGEAPGVDLSPFGPDRF